MKMGTEQGHSFTLVEMLVVIAMIGILVGIVMPVVARVRKKGDDTKCLSNLRQLHVATMAKIISDGRLPHATAHERYWWEPDDWEERRGWVTWRRWEKRQNNDNMTSWWYGTSAVQCITGGTIFAYAKDIRIYKCPVFAKAVLSAAEYNPVFTQPVYRTYVMNRSLSFDLLARITNSSTRLLFADAAYDDWLMLTLRSTHNAAASDWGLNEDGDSDSVIAGAYANEQDYDRYVRRARDGALEGTNWGTQLGVVCPKERIGEHHDGFGFAVFLDGHTEKLGWTNTQQMCRGL